jgi:uncharacterized membrane protein YedE/YeeE
MENFSPLSAAMGGALIGLSAALLWLANGRIAGISSVLGGLIIPRGGDIGWRIAFLAGLVGAPLAYALATGGPPIVLVRAGTGLLVAAGLLVGVGTRLSGGCTSGHGVCGLARVSPRSMAATGLFMAAAATVFITRHVLGA